jgi:predicted Zn-dependent peptidase
MKIEEFKDRRSRERVLKAVLDCGLPVFWVPKRRLARKAAFMGVGYGSASLGFRTESTQKWYHPPAGVPHFLEHQLFKKKEQNLSVDFSLLGADVNAVTGYHQTSFFFVCSNEFERNLETLLRLVCEPFFSEELVKREQMIIAQEIKMYDELPDQQCWNNLLAALFKHHPVRIPVGGTLESISKITPAVLQKCHQAFYRTKNMVLALAGDIDFPRVLKVCHKLMQNYLQCHGGAAEREPLPADPSMPRRRIEKKMPAARPKVLLGFKDIPVGQTGEKLLAQELQTFALLDIMMGKASAFFNRNYRRGLIDDSFSFSYMCHDSFGVSIIGGDTDQPEHLEEQIITLIEKTRRQGLKKRDVFRLRRKLLGRYLRSFDSALGCAYLFMAYYFREVDIFRVPALIKSLTPGTLAERLQQALTPERMAVSIIWPQ